MRNNNLMTIVVQGFYGNKTTTQIRPEQFDAIMLGWLDFELFEKMRDKEKIDRTILRVPGTDNLVLVYNKYREEEDMHSLQSFIQEVYMTRSRFNPTAVIPEEGVVLFSRCIACRINEDGELTSLEPGDYQKVEKYLTA